MKCHDFENKGHCSYGIACKYRHAGQPETEGSVVVLTDLGDRPAATLFGALLKQRVNQQKQPSHGEQ
jgi:hypothetical protein